MYGSPKNAAAPASNNTPPAALLLLDKPCGCTSFEALKPVKDALITGKVGHTGTLDKFAHGLLCVLTGKALKLSESFTRLDKCYEARVLFGVETDTLDPEGVIVNSMPPPPLQRIEAALDAFRGEILQEPPAYSAVHVDGQRAYKIARSGKTPPLKKRPVTIHVLSVSSYRLIEASAASSPTAECTLSVRCSSGTYIRALARDIARAVSSCAHLTALCRTQIGPYLLADAIDASSASPEEIRSHLIPQ